MSLEAYEANPLGAKETIDRLKQLYFLRGKTIYAACSTTTDQGRMIKDGYFNIWDVLLIIIILFIDINLIVTYGSYLNTVLMIVYSTI